MSTEKSSQALARLNEVNHKRVGDEEKQTLFQTSLLDMYNNDIGNFIVELKGVDFETMLSTLKLLEKFHKSSVSLCLSAHVRSIFEMLQSYPDAKYKLKLIILEHFLKGLAEADIHNISKDNVFEIGEFAASGVPLDDLEVSNASCMVLDKLMIVHHRELIPVLYSYSQQHRNNSTIYLRFVTVFARTASHSDAQFQACQALGVVIDLVQLCKANDILLQINALELLVDVSGTQSGLDYLCSSGTVQWLITISCGLNSSQAPDPLISAEALRTLGKIFEKASARSFDFVGKVDSGCIHHFLNTLLSYFEERDEANRIGGEHSCRPCVEILCFMSNTDLCHL